MPYGNILIVDDDLASLALLKAMLVSEDVAIDKAESGEAALEKLNKASYDIVITDIRMPGMDGLTLLNHIRQEWPNSKVVVMTAESTPATVVNAIKRNAFCYLTKPISRSNLLETVRAALVTPHEEDDIDVLNAKPNWITLEVRCKVSIADRLIHFFRELVPELDRIDRDTIATAFRELLLNAIEHGGRSDPSKKVRLTCIRGERSIVYYVRDPGEGFSVDNIPHAAVANAPDQPFGHSELRQKMGIRPGGFGILLTKNFADELMYSEKGNEVILIKYLNTGDKPM
jgi:CheY-like chemotaxis protein/anti-sigma regulatory factor (Ser/Thr protein kinase)